MGIMKSAAARKMVARKSGVHLEVSRYGTPTPTYYLVASWVAKASHREINAGLFKLAATIEETTVARGKATGHTEGWIVQIDRDRACVYLELAEGDAAEAERGMATLHEAERA